MQGFLFLTQYTQEELTNPANSAERTYIFVGLTRDGGHYVEATFAVTGRTLPADPQATSIKARDKARSYLRRNEMQLAGFDEKSFTPPLVRLRALVQSVLVEGAAGGK